MALLVGSSSELKEVPALKVSPKCENESNIFLQEIIQKTPQEYAVLSKWSDILKGIIKDGPTIDH